MTNEREPRKPVKMRAEHDAKRSETASIGFRETAETTKRKRTLTVSLETFRILSAEHGNADAYLASWFDD